MKKISDPLQSITSKIARHKGFLDPEFLKNWRSMMGGDLCTKTFPEKIVFPKDQTRDGVIYLWVCPTIAMDVQHAEPILIERINRYFGYSALSRIKIKQRSFDGLGAMQMVVPSAAVAEEPAPDMELQSVLARLQTSVAKAPKKP